MKVKFFRKIDFGKFIVQYDIIPLGFLARVVNKTKTHFDERDVYIFKTYEEMENYFGMYGDKNENKIQS